MSTPLFGPDCALQCGGYLVDRSSASYLAAHCDRTGVRGSDTRKGFCISIAVSNLHARGLV